MIIDSLTNTRLFVDMKVPSYIYVNSIINANGSLEVDSNDNHLISEIDSGFTPLGRLTKYTGGNQLMLHNESSGSLVFLKEGDPINIDCDFGKGLKYYINSEILRTKTRVGSKFEINLSGRKVFRVLFRGREVKNFTSDDRGITLQGNEHLLLDSLSEIIVYTYERNTAVGVVENDIEISYMQYRNIAVWGDADSPNFLSYLESGYLLESNNFESLSITPTVSKTGILTSFKGITSIIINNIENTLSLELFLDTSETTIPKWVGTNEFRVILSNPMFGRLVLINNCLLDSSESLIYSKEKNTVNLTIGCGNYIDIQISDGHDYGVYHYSDGVYGKKSVIKNSHRG